MGVMTKKQLYFVIVILVLALLWVLFARTDTMPQIGDTSPETAQESLVSAPEEVEIVEDISEVDAFTAEEFPEQVILEGEFLSLVDGVNPWDKVFKYMLLHDGVEVLRVDLRPLVGYSDIDIPQKLGVERGEKVRVIGIMDDGEFTVTSVSRQ